MKKSTIFKQIQRTMLIYLVILLFVTGAASVILLGYFSIRETMNHAAKESESAVRELYKYESLSELIDYWYDNRDTLQKVYDEGELDSLEQELREYEPALGSLFNVTDEEFLAMPDEEKALFATISYGRMSKALDDLKQSYNPVYMFSFIIRDGKEYFMVTGAFDGEKRVSQGGELYELGVSYDYVKGMWKHFDLMAEGDEKELAADSHVDTDFGMQLAASMTPIYDGDEIIGYMGVAESFRELVLRGLDMSKYMLLVVLLIFIVLEIRLESVLRKNASGPLEKTEKIVHDYMENKDSKAAVSLLGEINSRNEVQSLAEGFAGMITEIDNHIEHIEKMTAERERIDAELNVATQIQASMLPSVFPPFPDRTEFELYASMHPAKEVGGDFYDFFFTDEDHIVLVMGDVSGKGVPAALFMALSKTNIKNRTIMGGSASDIIGYVNDALCEGNEEGMFVTLWFAVIDLRSGEGVSINAGHEDPFLKRQGGRYEAQQYEHDIILGAIETMSPYTERRFKLEPGDALFVYTDGVAEAQNAAQELFGMERIDAALNKEENADTKRVIENVAEGIDEFVAGAPQFDDITMLSFKYLGRK